MGVEAARRASDVSRLAHIVEAARFGWRPERWAGVEAFTAGSPAVAREAAARFAGGKAPSVPEIAAWLARQRDSFGLLVESPEFLFAALDKVRGYPLFYAQTPCGLLVSNSAAAVRERAKLDSLDEAALLEFAMAGFVTGSETLCRGLKQLQAGEFLLGTKADGRLTVHRYYRYAPAPEEGRSEAALLDALEALTQCVFERLAADAAGRPILVPLSGGLDSRLILCKLKELGYAPLEAFSYGPAGNFEARAARLVAERLGVPWRMVASDRRAARRLFESPERVAYWQAAVGFSSAPSMREFEALYALRAADALPADAIIVNGQSGDYLTGNHIPRGLYENAAPGEDAITGAILDKHYGLWPDLLTEENRARLGARIRSLVAALPASGDPRADAIARYEHWEWQERQCKFVVNGQRLYDFLGLDWRLPLWDGALMDFWARVPFEHKYRQKLYVEYLERYDYRGLFKDFHPTIWRWPRRSLWVVPAAHAAGLLFGRRAKQAVYQHLRWIGHYGNQYGMIGLGPYLRDAGRARNPTSYFVKRWIDEAGVPFPQP